MTKFRSRLSDRAVGAGVAIDSDAVAALDAYFDLLKRWNRKINLTSLGLEPLSDEALDRLFLEPLAASHYIGEVVDGKPQPVWFDLGSGGGSPAIPLKIVRPAWRLTMVESRARKTAFLAEAVRMLSLDRATVVNVRFEELRTPNEVVDLVTVRAVREDQLLREAVDMLLAETGTLAMFGPAGTTRYGWELVRTIQLLPHSESSQLDLMRRVPRGTNRLTQI